jgi:hypothetical protein
MGPKRNKKKREILSKKEKKKREIKIGYGASGLVM